MGVYSYKFARGWGRKIRIFPGILGRIGILGDILPILRRIWEKGGGGNFDWQVGARKYKDFL